METGSLESACATSYLTRHKRPMAAARFVELSMRLENPMRDACAALGSESPSSRHSSGFSDCKFETYPLLLASQIKITLTIQ